MATPQYDFNINPIEDGPLSQSEIDANDALLDPQRIIADHERRQAVATEKLNEATLARLREENAALMSQNSELAKEQAYIKGRMDAFDTSSRDPALEYSEDELAAHGHALPTIEKTAKRESMAMEQRLRSELEQQYQAEIAALRAETANAIATQQQAVQSVTGALRDDFDSYVRQGARNLGLDINALKQDERFLARCARPLAVGSDRLWGEQLDFNIENQKKQETLAMLAEYARETGTGAALEATQEVPTSSGVRPLSPQVQKNLDARSKILAQVDAMQESFIAGTYHGTQEQYQKEKRELLAKADEIPINI